MTSCSVNHTEHLRTLFEGNVAFFVSKVVVHILTTDSSRVKKRKTRITRINKINFHTELRSREGSCPV